MRALIQRVKHASVTINEKKTASINKGMLVLLGIEDNDNNDDIEWLCGKIAKLRIFDDGDGHMNIDITQDKGEFLVVSQFTLFASTKKGNRPGFTRAARPEIAIPLYENFIKNLNITSGRPVSTGVFGANMKVELLNDGPVTIFIDTKDKE